MNPMPSFQASRLLPVTGTSLWRKRQLMVAGVCASAWLSGCGVFVSNDEFGLSWSGKPLAQLKQAWGQPADEKTQADGSTELRYDLKGSQPIKPAKSSLTATKSGNGAVANQIDLRRRFRPAPGSAIDPPVIDPVSPGLCAPVSNPPRSNRLVRTCGVFAAFCPRSAQNAVAPGFAIPPTPF